MPVTDSFVAFVLEQLEPVGAITPKRMFGGVGVYAGDLFFALLDNDVLYLKVNDSNRADFEAAGAGPFRPYGPGGEVMQYYEVPAAVLEDADELGRWARKAIAVAHAKKTSKPIRATKKKPARRAAARVKPSRSRTPSKRASSSGRRPARRKNRRR
jgi:DNA transformation protein and related proteins